MDADALSATPAARAALEALRAAAGAHGPMERHCLRHFAIAERLAGDRAFDRELLLCTSWLHDAGLHTPSRDPYGPLIPGGCWPGCAFAGQGPG
jgi:hypothetical protein